MTLECPASVVRRASCVVRRASCVVRRQHYVTTLKATVLVQSSSNLLRMFILMSTRTLLNMGVVGSKSRSLGQILEKPCYRIAGHSFGPMFFKLAQDVYLDEN